MRYLLAVVVVAALVLAGCGSSRTAPAPTRIVNVGPENGANELKAGYRIVRRLSDGSCEAGSDVLSGVYRCGARNGILDPCWASAAANGRTVDCLLEPWSHEVYRLSLNSALTPSPTDADYVWGMQLGGGERCLAYQGAHSNFHGQSVEYYCDGGHGPELLGRPDRTHSRWTIRELVSTTSGVRHYGPQASVAIAWFGRPSRLRR